jgi:hypothetical protein
MKMLRRPFLTCLIVFCLNHVSEVSAAEFTAKWIGTANGNWNESSNWDIGQVPKNTGVDTYDVIWDARPVIVTVTEDITIRNFTFASGGILSGPASRFNFTVTGDLQWTHGVLAISGRTTVEGTATLQGAGADSLKISAGVLFLKGHSALMSSLSFVEGGRMVNDAGAVFEADEFSGLVSDASNTAIQNEGTFSIRAGTQPFTCIYFFNMGTVEVAARTVELQAPQIFDFDQRGGELSLDGANVKGHVAIQAGSLEGRGYIQEAIVLGELSGELDFGKLSPGNNAATVFKISGRADGAFDRISVADDLFLGGTIDVRLEGGFTPEPADVFEIVTAAGNLSGQFKNINFGQRVPLADGAGSFLLDHSTTNPNSIVLRDFAGGPFTLGPGALSYQLPTRENSKGGCFVAPNALINLPDGNWAGGSLAIRFSHVLAGGVKILSFRDNPARPGDQFVADGPSISDLVLSFHGVPFATADIELDTVTCRFNANARNEAIVALLGHLYFYDDDFEADWFDQATDRYPRTTLTASLTDGAGAVSRIVREVPFPYLTGIGFRFPDEYLEADEHNIDLELLGIFSNSQRLKVPDLDTQWSIDCGTAPVDSMTIDGTPSNGEATIESSRSIQARCVVTATSGPFSATVGVVRNAQCVIILFQALFGRVTPPPALRASANVQPGISLATFYGLESLMQESAEGRRLANLYWQHTREVVEIVLANPQLLDQGISIMRAFQPGVSALLSGRGDESPITQTMIDQLNVFWDGLANVGSPGLRADLRQEQSRFSNFQPFVNKEFSQWAGLLGVPAPTQPRIQISGSNWAPGRFSLEINDVGGSAFSLWRSSNLSAWELVPNFELLRSDFTLQFADPQPPAARAFYQIRRTP